MSPTQQIKGFSGQKLHFGLNFRFSTGACVIDAAVIFGQNAADS